MELSGIALLEVNTFVKERRPRWSWCIWGLIKLNITSIKIEQAIYGMYNCHLAVQFETHYYFGIFCCCVVHTCNSHLSPCVMFQGCQTLTTCTVTVMRSLWSWAVINSPPRRRSTLSGSGIRRHCSALWSLWVHVSIGS